MCTDTGEASRSWSENDDLYEDSAEWMISIKMRQTGALFLLLSSKEIVASPMYCYKIQIYYGIDCQNTCNRS